MKSLVYVMSGFLILAIGCSDKGSASYEQAVFHSFELTLENTVINDFSILIDSNKNYHISHKHDSLSYGILPDSIYSLFENMYFKIKNNKAIQTKGEACYDCFEVAMNIISQNDTIQVHKFGDELEEFEPFLISLIQFNKNNQHQSKKGSMYFETQKMTINPVPMIEEFDNSRYGK